MGEREREERKKIESEVGERKERATEKEGMKEKER